MSDRRPLADRLAALTPVHREQNGATLILCELIDELIDATVRQSSLLAESLTRSAGPDVSHQRGHTPAAPVPAPGSKGDDSVRLTEPELPPADEPPGPSATKPGRPSKKAVPAKKAAAQRALAGRKAGTE